MIYIMRAPSCAGKSKFVAEHFKPHCVLSSAACRLALFDSDSKTGSGELVALHMKHMMSERLRFGTGYTVIDSKNLKYGECADYLNIAAKFRRPVTIISIDPPSVEELAWRYKQRTGDEADVVQLSNQIKRYYNLMPRFIEASHESSRPDIQFVRINQDWETVHEIQPAGTINGITHYRGGISL